MFPKFLVASGIKGMSLLDESLEEGKLAGIRKLPPSWVPPFFAISSHLYLRYAQEKPGTAQLIDLIDHEERSWIERNVSGIFSAQPEDVSLIVRSNASGEGLAQRGLLKSYRCDGTVEGILSASQRVYESATEFAERGIPVGLVVQLYCAPTLWGHLSNERRVAEESRRWLCEMHSIQSANARSMPRVIPFRVERTSAAEETELLSGTRQRLLLHLRSIGRYFYDRGGRRHLEWVWDGSRLWIVQSDEAPDPAGASPEPVVVLHPTLVAAKKLKHFREASLADARRWQKLKCVQVFREMGLPTTRLFVLCGARVVKALADGKRVTGLVPDLRELTRFPLVVRTDVEGRTTLLAPSTNGLHEPGSALSFMQDTAQLMLGTGVKPSQVCFIAHRFIPASASAFSLARPLGNRVRIDALWGLPDGLDFCPHDSFEVNARTGAVVGKRIRYKPNFLAALADGRWEVGALGAPWDWRQSLDDKTLRSIASASTRLAKAVNKSVVVMWFAGVPVGSGHPELVPWRFIIQEAPSHVESAAIWRFKAQPFYIRNRGDFDSLRDSVQSTSSVVLRPDGPHLRSESFLADLGQVVKEHGLRIDLEGSPLSHAYYVLRRTGASVACVDPINPKAVRLKFEKLVRDRIPLHIQKHGERVQAVNIAPAELIDVLKAKALEESFEMLWASSSESLHEEMADVIEVLRALCRATGSSLQELQTRAARKRKKVGGFGKGIVLVETEETPLIQVRTQDQLFESPPNRVYDSRRAIVAAGRRPKTKHDRIIIPLIPSVPSRLRGPATIHLRQLALSFKVWYREKSIEIVLEREAKPVNTAQLSFDFS